MDIALRYEGGGGDCLLANRFVPAILEKYPDAKIHAFIDSEGKTFQKEILELCYPHFYESIQVIPHKKYKEFWVDCQFGTDNYYGAWENVPDEWRDKMEAYDCCFDMHIDSLKWTNYDFDWSRYFKFFSKPKLRAIKQKKIVLHLISSTSDGHRLKQEYLERLITLICQSNRGHEVVAIATEDTQQFYSKIKESNFQISVSDIEGVVRHIASAEFMISTDSGFRYLAYGYGVPTLTFSQHCPSPYSAIPSHMIRWLIFPETCYPLNFDANHIVSRISNILKEKGNILVPYIDDFTNQCIRRIYTINTDRTKLRE